MQICAFFAKAIAFTTSPRLARVCPRFIWHDRLTKQCRSIVASNNPPGSVLRIVCMDLHRGRSRSPRRGWRREEGEKEEEAGVRREEEEEEENVATVCSCFPFFH